MILRGYVLACVVAFWLLELSAEPPAADVTGRGGAGKVELKKVDVVVDLPLIRSAVTKGLVSAREGKQALEFDRLRREMKTGDLKKDELTVYLDELGISWVEGEALLNKIAFAINLLSNGDFELGKEFDAEHWTVAATHPPRRSDAQSQDGSFAMHSKLTNFGAKPCEGLLRSEARVDGEERYALLFWIKPIAVGPSYVTQYKLDWIDREGRGIGGTGFVQFNGRVGAWSEVTVPDLVAPEKTEKVSLTFRFVTGAVENGHGEIFIDEVLLRLASAVNSGN